MHGDFTRWALREPLNWNGILHQQGRVLLDVDTNQQTRLVQRWQDQAARSAFGRYVAAVPNSEPDSFKITGLREVGAFVEFDIAAGHLWADGLLVYLANEPPEPPLTSRRATKLDLAAPLTRADLLAVPFAVILEVWREALHGFQVPEILIEPALGGPDTAERVLTAFALRIVELEGTETCTEVARRIEDDLGAHGKLTVTLQPSTTIGDGCPIVAAGGYSGFEHHLFRVEIALTSAAPTRFKWSRFNGGLVGRGEIDTASVLTIYANQQGIRLAGLPGTFYVEGLAPHPDRGTPPLSAEMAENWEVIFGATATLDSEGRIALDPPIFGAIPTGTERRFFRVWDGIRPIGDFPIGGGVELVDGIRLEFEADTGSNYRPGDYWAFPLRLGEVEEFEGLPSEAPPDGVRVVRVPLATVTPVGPELENWEIDDCRRVFPPLTELSGCCTIRVGDGVVSYGDVTSIQEAVNRLPPNGGEICVLPGTYHESVLIEARHNIRIHGCGDRSLVIAPEPAGGTPDLAAISIRECAGIQLDGLQVIGNANGPAVLADDSTGVTLHSLTLSAARKPGAEVLECGQVVIEACRIQMRDVTSGAPGIFVIGQDVLIERNDVSVIPEPLTTTAPATGPAGQMRPHAGRGGIQIGGTSERVRILNNLIHDGCGNGITLGHLRQVQVGGAEIIIEEPIVYTISADAFDPCAPPGGTVEPPGDGEVPPVWESAGTLYEIRIEENRIFDMGSNGISVVQFFDLDQADELITVERLEIRHNHITGCLSREVESIPPSMLDAKGYGAIALADVEHLVIHDNRLEDNSAGDAEPVCGIFVLHASGMDVSRNLIFNRQRAPGAVDVTKTGRRGGICVMLAVAPTSLRQVGVLGLAAGPRWFPSHEGEPALLVHENIVSCPLGRALSATALGPVSVVGNQFTARRVVVDLDDLAFIAGTVAILNLGISNEFYLQYFLFSGPTSTGPALDTSGLREGDDVLIFEPAEGLDDYGPFKYLANGNILFNYNQCVLDVLETGSSLAITSVLLMTLDDLSFVGNQCDCSTLDDFVFVHAALIGIFSVRATSNRFKEGILNALLSAVTFSFLQNTTAHNQGTHCILAAGPSAWLVRDPNTILWDIWGLCSDESRLVTGYDHSAGVGQPLSYMMEPN